MLAKRLLPLLAGASALASCATMGEPPAGQKLASAIHYQQRTAGGQTPFRAHVVTIDLTSPDISFGVTPADTSGGMEHVARRTSSYLEQAGATVAVNASHFRSAREGHSPREGEPVDVWGAAISGGHIVSPVEAGIDKRVDSIICFHQARVEILNGQSCISGYRDAVAAGPRLLEDGTPRTLAGAFATERQPRSAIGISADRRRAWILVVDGGQPESAGATLPELASLFLALGASDAINLDGGGSSTLAARTGGGVRLLNSPVHEGIAGRERPVANHILVFSRR